MGAVRHAFLHSTAATSFCAKRPPPFKANDWHCYERGGGIDPRKGESSIEGKPEKGNGREISAGG